MSEPGDPIRFSIPDRPKDDTRKRLGKGLGALLGETRREEPLVTGKREGGPAAPPSGGLAPLPVSAIEPLPGQPRRRFDEAALDECQRLMRPLQDAWVAIGPQVPNGR